MGGAVSTGRNNDELINNLLEADYIRTPTVARVFRSVDRGEYFLPEARNNAYKDLAWKSGNLHLSAPCIYSEVMEGLCLSPGLSFLNLGSGTGYLSTMVGLVLGTDGTNHGVEIHADVIQYANRKVEVFKKFSGAIDEFDFCEPKFMQGNCLCLMNECRQYDRIYCGAACPENYEKYIKNLLKVDGILVMPLNDQLLQIKRTSQTNYEMRSLLPVSFATLVQPVEGKQELLQMFPLEPYTLQEMCRAKIRNILRNNIEKEFPSVRRAPPTPKKASKRKIPLRHMVVPLFDNSEDSSDDEVPARGTFPRAGLRADDESRIQTHEVSGLLNYIGMVEKICDDTLARAEFATVATVELADKVSGSGSPKKTGREKFDSGLGDEEIVEAHEETSDSSTDGEDRMDFEVPSSTEDEEDQSNKRGFQGFPQNVKWRRIALSNDSDSNQDSNQESEKKPVENEIRVSSSPYTAHMKEKIQGLPLPSILKNYINFYREF